MAKAIWAVACAALVVAIPASLPGRASLALAAGAGGADPTAPPADVPSGRPGSERGAADASYRLGPEDVLKISVWENKELTMEVVVRPDGMISFPLIQDIQAEGMTASELASVIRQKLGAYIKEPQVAVIVKEVNAPKIFVLGNVTKPGTFPLRGTMSVLHALTLAGGFNQYASVRKIRLVRNGGTRQEVRTINYYRMIEGSGEGNYLLMPGDTIVVP